MRCRTTRCPAAKVSPVSSVMRKVTVSPVSSIAAVISTSRASGRNPVRPVGSGSATASTASRVAWISSVVCNACCGGAPPGAAEGSGATRPGHSSAMPTAAPSATSATIASSRRWVTRGPTGSGGVGDRGPAPGTGRTPGTAEAAAAGGGARGAAGCGAPPLHAQRAIDRLLLLIRQLSGAGAVEHRFQVRARIRAAGDRGEHQTVAVLVQQRRGERQPSAHLGEGVVVHRAHAGDPALDQAPQALHGDVLLVEIPTQRLDLFGGGRQQRQHVATTPADLGGPC